MKTTNYLLILFLTIFCCACSDDDVSSGWTDVDEGEGYYLLCGSVTMNGEPVNAAAVLLTPGGGTYLTGSDGIFIFNDVPSGTYEIKVYKEGCQPFNKSLTVNKHLSDMALTVTENKGHLHINKGYIDMGSNASNNVGAFTITNKGESELTWQATWGARWITKMEPSSGTVPAGGSAAVSFTINRDRLSSETFDNHTGIVVRSTTGGDGSLGELLVTAFGQGNGINLINDNSDLEYVMVGDLYVQTVDMSNNDLNKESALRLCSNSIKGGFNDWRLPTLDELATMYENRNAIGGFTPNTYWSSDLTENEYYPYKGLKFSNGAITEIYKTGSVRARAVRKDPVEHIPMVSTLDVETTGNIVILKGEINDEGLPKYTEKGFIVSTQPVPTFNNGTKYVVDGQTSSEFKYIIDNFDYGKTYYYVAYATNALGTSYGKPIRFSFQHELYVYIPELHLMVQRQDIVGPRTVYALASKWCEQSRIGGFSDWRLPTIDELVAISKYMDIYNLKFTYNSSYPSSYCYWSSTESSAGWYFIFEFYTKKTYQGKDSNEDYSYVRAVRTANL